MKTTAQKQSAARQREARAQAAATNERIAEQLDMLAQSDDPGLQTIRAGRVMIRATAGSAATLARSFRGATSKRGAPMRKRQEHRFYPVFVPGVTSTAEYVGEYMTLNGSCTMAGSFEGLFDLLSMTSTPCALYENGATDYTPIETTDDEQAAIVATAATLVIATAQAQAAETCAPDTTDTAEQSAELVTCDGPELADAVATVADTPAAMGDAIGAGHTPTEVSPADCTDPRETRAQAGGYTQQPETLRADYLRAAEAGNTQQAGSKRGAWSAMMFRTADGRAGLAFKRPGHAVELADHTTGGERMRALQAMAQAAEQAAATTYNREEADKLREHGRNFTAAQCELVAANFERDNNHGGALAWRCMGAKAYDLAARAGANTMAHDKAGHLTPALADQRAAIAAELKARQQASSTHTHQASSTEPPDYTAPLKTQAPDCTQAPETPADDAPAFQRARPAHVDLRALIAQGMATADLVGLGVVYKGDMANASGHGAIVEAHDGGARGVLVAVTLEDGRHMAQLDGYSFAARPGNRYALDWKRHGAPYLAELAASRAALKAATSSGKEIKAQRHAAELVRLAEEFPHLERAESRHAGGKLAARNIRTMLKAAFPWQKFSVTSDYNCIRLRWTDGPTDAAVTAIIGRFDIGRADYNTDYFYTEDSAWSELFGGVQYLFTNRETSPELVAQVLQDFNAKHGTQATPEDWRKQSGPFNYSQRDGDAYCRWFREMLNATDATPPAKTTRKGAKA